MVTQLLFGESVDIIETKKQIDENKNWLRWLWSAGLL